jgi:outer membrane immunogenic protein
MLRSSGIAIAAFFLLTSIGWGQDNRWDVNLGYAGVFTKQSSGNGTVLDPTNSGAFLVTGRWRFSEHSSLIVNYSHTADSQVYFASPLTIRIHTTIGEYSGAYVFSFHQSEKVEPFVFVGAAALVFYPSYNGNYINGVQSYIPATQQTKPAGLYGGGIDWRIFSSLPLIHQSPLLSKHLALRLQYRGLIYKAPSFNVQNLFTGARGHLAEPSVGIVIKF